MKKNIGLAILGVSTALASCTPNDNSTASADSASDNAAYENIMTRTSVRAYDPDRTIAPDTVEMLLKAAMAAPTAVNKQPWAFVVLDNRQALDSLAESLPYAKMLTHAPLAVVVCGDMSRTIEGEGQPYWIQDVSAATENLLLAAHALGLGAVWTGVYPIAERVDSVKAALGLPAEVTPLAVVPIGYPATDATPKDKWDPAKVHYNKW